MATEAEREKFRALAGMQLPVDGGEPAPYTDAMADAYLAASPACPMVNGGGADVYGAAAQAWEDKALALSITAAIEGAETGVLVKDVSQGDASITYGKAQPLGTTKVKADSPDGMRALAARLRRRSCNGGDFRSVSVLPPEVVTPGRGYIRDYDGEPYTDPRRLILDPRNNVDRVINLPEVD